MAIIFRDVTIIERYNQIIQLKMTASLGDSSSSSSHSGGNNSNSHNNNNNGHHHGGQQRRQRSVLIMCSIALMALALQLCWMTFWMTSSERLLKMIEMASRGETCQRTGYRFHPVLSNWTASESVDALVQGPGLEYLSTSTTTTMRDNHHANDSNDEPAICVFERNKLSLHFPHAMQQLYSCISFFQSQPNRLPILEIVRPPYSGVFDDLRSRLYEWKNRRFIGAFYESLSNALHVTIVEKDKASPRSVRRRVPHAWKDGYDMLPGHAAMLRNAFLETRQQPPAQSCPADHVRIGILNRESSRSILNTDYLQRAIESHTQTAVSIVYFEGKSFEEQIDFFARTDIVISPHGAQLTAIPFMPDCGGVLEIFPDNYWIPDFYGSLAASAGLFHTHVYLGYNNDIADADDIQRSQQNVEAVMESNKHLRKVARQVDLCPAIPPILEGIDLLLDSWATCCRQRSSTINNNDSKNPSLSPKTV